MRGRLRIDPIIPDISVIEKGARMLPSPPPASRSGRILNAVVRDAIIIDLPFSEKIFVTSDTVSLFFHLKGGKNKN